MVKDIIYRLMIELPDGSFRVSGHEKHENGRIYHKAVDINVAGNVFVDIWEDVVEGEEALDNFVEYHRKDLYTGVTVDGQKVFERDEGLLNGHVLGDTLVTVVYEAPSFKVRHADGTLYELNEYFYKVTGIEGVK